MRGVRPSVAIALFMIVTSVVALSMQTLGATPATFTIMAGRGSANGGLNFNGTANGHLTVTVPLGAQVELTLKNEGALPHSIQIIPSGGSLPTAAVPASALAFPGAQTPNPQSGTPPGQTAVARFTATKAGKYRMICGFPGHAVTGQWANFVVSTSSITTPSMTVTP